MFSDYLRAIEALEQQQAEIEQQQEKIYLAIDAIASHRLNPDSAIDYICIAEMYLKGKKNNPESITEQRNRYIEEMVALTGFGVVTPNPPEDKNV